MVARNEIVRIIGSLEAFAGVSDSLGDDDDLFERGLDSFGSVQLMLTLEERYEIEFPDQFLNRRVFSSIRTIREAIDLITLGADA